MSKLFWTPTIRQTMSCKQEPKNTADPYAVAVMSDSFTVTGHEARRATSFQVAEHGYLTDHASGTTQLFVPTIYIGIFYFDSLLPKPPIR